MKTFLTVTLILLIASPLYFFKLSQIPPAFYVDESVVGYNAYSILETGKDEYGQTLPVAFKLFGSYTPPLFVYFLIPFIKTLGLNVLATRLPNAILGLLTGLLVYFLAKRLKINPLISLILFLISPWNIFFARLGYEIYLGFSLFCLSAYLFFSSFKNQRLILPAYFVLSLSSYASHPQRILAPLFLILFFIVYRKNLNKKHLWGILLSFFLQIPHLYLLSTPAFWTKTSLFSSFSFFNFFSQASTYLSPKSLFFLPDPDPQRSIPFMSVFYSWMLIPYLFGLYFLCLKIKQKENKFILILIISSLIPASLANDPFSTQRNFQLFLPLLLIISLGCQYLLKKISPKIFIPLILFSLLAFWRSYFVLFPADRASAWHYGYQQLNQILDQYKNDPIIIDSGQTAYSQIAFFQKFPPSRFQQQNSFSGNYYQDTSFGYVHHLDNIEFRPILWEKDAYKPQIIIGSQLAISSDQVSEHHLEPLFLIKDPQNRIVFQGYKTNPAKKSGQNEIE